jgi:hypothetical protein
MIGMAFDGASSMKNLAMLIINRVPNMSYMFIVLLITTNWFLKMRGHSVLSSQMDKTSVKKRMPLPGLAFPKPTKRNARSTWQCW